MVARGGKFSFFVFFGQVFFYVISSAYAFFTTNSGQFTECNANFWLFFLPVIMAWIHTHFAVYKELHQLTKIRKTFK